MKVGTDAVVLGAWANIGDAKKILDIGTGCGVIALMMAQRTVNDARIDALEVDADDAFQASENVKHSPWPEKVMVHHVALQKFVSNHRYDLIVSNPPFFNDSLHSPLVKRTSARHTSSLSFHDFLLYASQVLNEQGRIAIIIPFQEGLTFQKVAEDKFKFHVIRKMALYSRPAKKQERWLFEFARAERSVEETTLYIHDQQGWSKEYQNLTHDFYLNF